MAKKSKALAVSESIAEELDKVEKKLGERARIRSRETKKNYAQELSTVLATKVANFLRPRFEGILPDVDGHGQESRARTAKGVKKLDVNYSTLDLGLGLGVSIKTINFPDEGTGRYTKNVTRVDNELRAEAQDYHERQPFAVMIALIFMPVDACADGKRENMSSFAHAVLTFRGRAGRRSPSDGVTLFERIFIGLYSHDGENRGKVDFFDVLDKPRKNALPRFLRSFSNVAAEITSTFDARNGGKVRTTVEWDEDLPTSG
jgi:hypothetical protein